MLLLAPYKIDGQCGRNATNQQAVPVEKEGQQLPVVARDGFTITENIPTFPQYLDPNMVNIPRTRPSA